MSLLPDTPENIARWRAEVQALYPDAAIEGEGQFMVAHTRDGKVVRVVLTKYQPQNDFHELSGFGLFQGKKPGGQL